MKIKQGTPLRITQHLLQLERGRDELLLANYLDLRPLYIKTGRNYILNFLKAVSELKTYKQISDAFPHEINLLDTLLNHGIIAPYGIKSQDHRYSPEIEPDFENKRSMFLYLLISQSCNMGCVYCLNGAQTYQKHNNLKMSSELAIKSIEKCLNIIVSQGYLEIIFFGGEPLLNWPLAKEIITYCETVVKKKYSDKLLKYHVTSNLSFVPNDLIEWAKKYDIGFLCDLDGPRKIHNLCRPFKDGRPTHDIIIRNIQRLLTAGLTVDVRSTVTAFNQDYLLEIAEHHKSLGVKSCGFIPVNPVNSDEDILDDRLLPSPQRIISGLTEIYKSRIWREEELYPFNQYVSRLGPASHMVVGCGMPYGNTAVVDVNGEVYPCIYLVGLKRFCLGSMNDGSYPNRDVIRWMHNCLHVDHLEDCKSCPWRYMCGGGCPLGRLTVVNNPKATTKVKRYCKHIACDHSRTILELLMWDKAREASASLLNSHRNGAQEDVLRSVRC